MVAHEAYIAGRLHRLGDWDTALAVLARSTGTEAAELRAEIGYERYLFQVDGLAAAVAAIEALDPESAWGQYLRAKLAYSRLLFDKDPQADDYQTAEAGFQAAAKDPALRGRSLFHHGVLADNIAEDHDAAKALYDQALAIARAEHDTYLESYVIRHLAAHTSAPAERLGLLRRSLHLRSAAGARPQVAAAMLTLAQELEPDDPERAALVETARSVAEELRLSWVLAGLDELPAGSNEL
jgi:hypothetical protein